MKSSEELLATVDWEDIAIRLAGYVGYRSRRWAIPAEVEDIVSETLCRIIDGDYKNWDPEEEPNFLRFCMSVANGLLRNLVRKAHRRLESRFHDDFDEDHRVEPVLASKRIEDRDDARAFALLRERVSGDEIVTAILDHYAEGVEKTRHIAESLGLSAPEIHNGKRRLLGHVQAVRALLEEEVSDA